MSRDRVLGMLMGTAIGDSLGAPVETMTAKQIKKRFGRVTKYHPAKKHKYLGDWPAGKWTDDTQLTLATALALANRVDFNMSAIVDEHVRQINFNEKGWGRSTRDSIRRIEAGKHWSEAGNPGGAGNGVAMKVSPLAAFSLIKHSDLGFAGAVQAGIPYAIDYALMTHNSVIGVKSGVLQMAAVGFCLGQVDGAGFNSVSFIEYLVELEKQIDLAKRTDIFPGEVDKLSVQLHKLKSMQYFQLSTSEIITTFGGGDCYVYHSLPFTLAFFMRNQSMEGLYDVVNAGGDTDSNGAMYGALLGALYGVGVFPRDLIEGLLGVDEVYEVANHFCDAFGLS